MQPGKTKSVKRTKKVAAAPYVAKQAPKKETNPLIEKRPKNFGIGTLTVLDCCSVASVIVCYRWYCAAKEKPHSVCPLA